MKTKTIRLKPDEYKSVSGYGDMLPDGMSLPMFGLIITKNNKKIAIRTPFNVDNDCEIEVTYNENTNAGKVKYLKSSKRRKYYNFLKWDIILLEVISLIILLFEVGIFKNYAVEGSRTSYLLFPAIGTWLTSIIVIYRDIKGINKWIFAIFGYLLLLILHINFFNYLYCLITELI